MIVPNGMAENPVKHGLLYQPGLEWWSMAWQGGAAARWPVVGWFECVKLGQVRAEQAAPNRQHATDMAAPCFTANPTKTKSWQEVRMDKSFLSPVLGREREIRKNIPNFYRHKTL